MLLTHLAGYAQRTSLYTNIILPGGENHQSGRKCTPHRNVFATNITKHERIWRIITGHKNNMDGKPNVNEPGYTTYLSQSKKLQSIISPKT